MRRHTIDRVTRIAVGNRVGHPARASNQSWYQFFPIRREFPRTFCVDPRRDQLLPRVGVFNSTTNAGRGTRKTCGPAWIDAMSRLAL